MINRRDFLKALAATTSSLAIAPSLAAQNKTEGHQRDRLGELLPQRRLGATKEAVTMLGVGGAHIGRMEEREAQRVIETALERGVRFFDTAESYQKGDSERRYGRFLVPKYRDVVFIMSKTLGRDADTARQQLEGTLRRLNTDHLDLWQIHSVTDPQDVDRRLESGVLNVLLEAQKQGKTRYIGFTGHRTPKAHQRMLERTQALQTCQMPINVLDPSSESFIGDVLPALVERKMGVLAMKTLADGYFFRKFKVGKSATRSTVVPDHLSLTQALHFVWSLPVSVLISGVDNVEQMKQNIQLAWSFTELDKRQRAELIEKVADLAGPPVEYYKK